MSSSVAIEAATATPVPWPMPRAVLFDLDGTLIDSVPDITLAINELVTSEQLPALEEAQVRRLVGHGLRTLVLKAYLAEGVALDLDSLDCRNDAMMEIYPRHLTGRTTLMPGVRETLEFFRARGCTMAVVTNKLLTATQTILEHFGIAQFFAVVIGESTEASLAALARKPQPDMLLEALRRMGVSPQQAVMIGDSGVDVRAAQAAGVTSIAVRGGYSGEPLESFDPDAVADSMGHVRAYFEPR